MTFPPIIQGGMGAGISGWRLARAVSSQGQIGVVSGTALDLMLARRLELGDPGGDLLRALACFPDQDMARRMINRYFVAEGKAPDKPFSSKPMVSHKLSRHLEELMVVSNFVEVFLAKEGHGGIIGINYLHKIQTPLLPSLYGAMLAGVDIVIVGAGIPIDIAAVIDCFTRGESAQIKLHVRDAGSESDHTLSFAPGDLFPDMGKALKRPLFFPIVSSVTLATVLVRKGKGQVDGLIIEGPSAGGHNAPPRGQVKLNPEGEPVYGPRDAIDIGAIKALGLPFWLAGSYASPEKLREALSAGASGIQVGTLFAFCQESGLREDLKDDILQRCQVEIPRAFTDPVASPTGFPFKVVPIAGTLSETAVYEERVRRCDLGYLRESYEKDDGTVGWRCSAEDEEAYVSKGGNLEETIGRKCLCNGLMANIGMAQVRNGSGEEAPLVTCGDDLKGILHVLDTGAMSYSSSDVLDFLLGHGKPATAPGDSA